MEGRGVRMVQRSTGRIAIQVIIVVKINLEAREV